MIDIHNHSLYSIDDGSSSIEESIRIIKQLSNLGFKKLVLTPHYIEGSKYNCNNSDKLLLLNNLNIELKKNQIPIKLYLGNETFINKDIHNLVSNQEVFTINNTRYILIEFSLTNLLNDIEDILYDLSLYGYKIIIAHPERYSFFQDDYKLVHKLKESTNILYQCNYNSIVGKYGHRAKKLMKYLLKNNLVTFLGTDVHKDRSSVLKDFEKSKKKIIKLIGEKEFNKLSDTNIELVLNNEEIED